MLFFEILLYHGEVIFLVRKRFYKQLFGKVLALNI